MRNGGGGGLVGDDSKATAQLSIEIQFLPSPRDHRDNHRDTPAKTETGLIISGGAQRHRPRISTRVSLQLHTSCNQPPVHWTLVLCCIKRLWKSPGDSPNTSSTTNVKGLQDMNWLLLLSQFTFYRNTNNSLR